MFMNVSGQNDFGIDWGQYVCLALSHDQALCFNLVDHVLLDLVVVVVSRDWNAEITRHQYTEF